MAKSFLLLFDEANVHRLNKVRKRKSVNGGFGRANAAMGRWAQQRWGDTAAWRWGDTATRGQGDKATNAVEERVLAISRKVFL